MILIKKLYFQYRWKRLLPQVYEDPTVVSVLRVSKVVKTMNINFPSSKILLGKNGMFYSDSIYDLYKLLSVAVGNIQRDKALNFKSHQVKVSEARSAVTWFDDFIIKTPNADPLDFIIDCLTEIHSQAVDLNKEQEFDLKLKGLLTDILTFIEILGACQYEQ